MKNKFFITGIGTDVGKTIVSAIVVEALKADYWKPIQAGDLEWSDTHKVKNLVANSTSQFFDNAYALKHPMSPHAAAEIEGIEIEVNKIKEPQTSNHLVIEGAGGLLVPLNNKDTILDLIKEDYQVIVVSRNYLGSINHTLLTIELLKREGKQIAGIIFNGEENKATQEIIAKKTGVKILGRVEWMEEVNSNRISDIALQFSDEINGL